MATKEKYEDFLEKIASNIKNLRIEHGYTQEDMAKFGFNYRHYQKLESGSHSPSLNTLFRISETFDVKFSDLFR